MPLRYALLLLVSAAVIALVVSQGPLPQDQSYHLFADSRSIAGVPNALDTLSNAAFLAMGLAGSAVVLRLRKNRDTFAETREVTPYLVFFGGMCFIATGSMYYHVRPEDWTLLWDRLPMTVSFMAFFSIVITERFGHRPGRLALLPLLGIGILSVLYWYVTESAGRGDLRPYVLVQFYPIVIIPLATVLLPGRYTLGWVFTLVIAIYAGAKFLEVHDAQVLHLLGGAMSGHSLKHLVAAAAPLPLLWMLLRRKATAAS